MRRMIFAVLGICFLSMGSLSALPQLAKGARVRLWSSANGLKATVATVTASESDTLRLSVESRSGRFARLTHLPLSVPWASVSKMEVRQKGGSKALMGAVIGFAAGALVGGVVEYATYSPGSFGDGGNRLGWSAFVAGIGGATGLLLGLVIGANTTGERWQSIPLHIQPNVSLNGASKLEIVARFSFR